MKSSTLLIIFGYIATAVVCLFVGMEIGGETRKSIHHKALMWLSGDRETNLMTDIESLELLRNGRTEDAVRLIQDQVGGLLEQDYEITPEVRTRAAQYEEKYCPEKCFEDSRKRN